MKSKIPPVILFIFSCALAVTVKSNPIIYSFSGSVTSVQSYNATISDADLNALFGGVAVSYTFEVDFDRDVSTYTNSAATWDYFYAQQIGDGLVHSVLGGVPISSSPAFNAVFTNGTNLGELEGGSGVRIDARSLYTSQWAVNDWTVGQSFQFTDGAIPAQGGNAVYAFGNVTLNSITAVPDSLNCATIGATLIALFFIGRKRSLRQT